MAIADTRHSGLVLGAWGAVQATTAGIAIACSGALRDIVAMLADAGQLGSTLQHPSTGYAANYMLEIVLLLAAIVAIGPLVRSVRARSAYRPGRIGLAEMPS